MQASTQQAAREVVSGGSRGQGMAGLSLRPRRVGFKEEEVVVGGGGVGVAEVEEVVVAVMVVVVVVVVVVR